MSISSQVVSLSIVLATRAASQANFGTPAIFCNTPYVGGKTYELSAEGLAAMVTDGFSASSGEYYRGYQLAAAMSAQEPHADKVVVYGRTAQNSQHIELTPLNTAEGYTYTFSVQVGSTVTDISYLVPGSATTASVVTALQGLLNAVSGVTASDDTTHVSITPTTSNTFVQLSGTDSASIQLLDISTDAGIATDLAAAAADPNLSFYRFVIDSYSEAENNAAAVWAEANANRFFAQSADTTNVADAAGTGVGQDFFAAGYNRSQVCHSNDMPGSFGAAIVGRQAALDPGTSSYAYQVLQSLEPDVLSATHLANAKAKNVFVYALNSGNRHTWYGVAASGRSMRIQDAIDLLDARIKEAILSTFLGSEYIPMDDAGFAQMEGAVRSVLNNFVANGIANAEGLSVTVPAASSLSAADLAAGILRSIKFSVVFPNDMQKVIIAGTVSFN